MNINLFAKRVAVAAGFLFLCAAPKLTRGQSNTPAPGPAAPMVMPAVRPHGVPTNADDFAGLEYTAEQKAKMDEIHQHTKTLKDAVVKDEKLTVEQRDAMLQGYDRMERGQVYRLLTTAQQKEVRERIRARHIAEQAAKTKQSAPQ
jgi:hypothetical protein